jgi:hypothetical protein
MRSQVQQCTALGLFPRRRATLAGGSRLPALRILVNVDGPRSVCRPIKSCLLPLLSRSALSDRIHNSSKCSDARVMHDAGEDLAPCLHSVSRVTLTPLSSDMPLHHPPLPVRARAFDMAASGTTGTLHLDECGVHTESSRCGMATRPCANTHDLAWLRLACLVRENSPIRRSTTPRNQRSDGSFDASAFYVSRAQSRNF